VEDLIGSSVVLCHGWVTGGSTTAGRSTGNAWQRISIVGSGT